MNVIYEDNHLLVVDKPAGTPTMGSELGVETVHSWATDYLKRRYNKPGNVFVGIVSRLDRLTTGVLVLARTSKAASRLTIQFGGPGKSKKVSTRAEKLYLAVVEGNPIRDSSWKRSDTLVDSVWKDDAAYRMRVAPRPRSDTQSAELRYHVLDANESHSLLAVRLLTGRKHQIRLQFSERGHPILGDEKYGARASFPIGIALHSWQLLIAHPTREEMLLFQAPAPKSWSAVLPKPFDATNIQSSLPDDFRLNHPSAESK